MLKRHRKKLLMKYQNAFVKADLKRSLDEAATGTFDNDINITATEQYINGFVAINDKIIRVIQE